MKKVLAVLLALVMVLAMAACGSSDGGEEVSVDMSKYPSDLSEWTGQNFIDYYTEAGVYTEDGAESWLQDHSYWTGTPVSECAGWWDDAGTIGVSMVLILDPTLADTSQEQYDEWINSVKDTKKLPTIEGFSDLGTMSHLAGNVIFANETILDEDFYNKVEDATQQLFTALNVTPEF